MRVCVCVYWGTENDWDGTAVRSATHQSEEEPPQHDGPNDAQQGNQQSNDAPSHYQCSARGIAAARGGGEEGEEKWGRKKRKYHLV